MRVSKLVLPAFIAAVIFVNPGAAQAQTLEEIIVTAQKREESVQDVPIALQAFTGEEIRNLRITRASDITRLAPNLNLSTQNTASRQINIRGVGTSDFFGNSAGSVAITMDEVTMSSSYLSSLGLYDLERDPHEMQDVSGDAPEQVERLMALMPTGLTDGRHGV